MDYIDTSGLGELVSAFSMAARHGATLKIVSLPGRVHGLLQMTKLVTVFDAYELEDEAVASFASTRAVARTS